jgi:hypothetical protein
MRSVLAPVPIEAPGGAAEPRLDAGMERDGP